MMSEWDDILEAEALYLYYESLIAKLRLILITQVSKWNSEPKISVVYPGKAFYLLCDCVL